MIFDVLITLALALAGALMLLGFVFTAATFGWLGAIAPLVCCLVAYAAIGALWACGGKDVDGLESAA